MPFSTKETPEFMGLSPLAQEAIYRDIAESGNDNPTIAFAPGAYTSVPRKGSVFADSNIAQPATGALSVASPTAENLGYDSGQGALSAAPTRQPFDLQKMIDQFVPKDDSASKYVAISAALGRPTAFGTIGEKFANISQALMEQKANQERLRGQYVPIIMQQVAAQQARDEQAAYKAQLAAQAQQAAVQMQQERLAQQAQLAAEARAAAAERAAQHADLMKTLAGNKPEPQAQIVTTPEGVFERTRDGLLKKLTDPTSGAPLSGKQTQAQKPIPPNIVKEQGELLNQIGTVSGINSDLSELNDQIKKGKLQLGPVRNVESTARNLAGMSDEVSRNFATFKAKMENLRNATLLLNKGVQTEGDAQRAFNELFANLNDQDVVSQRLAEIQKLNERAAALKKNQINAMRSEYGHPEMDFAKYENQPASVNLQKPADSVENLINKYRSK